MIMVIATQCIQIQQFLLHDFEEPVESCSVALLSFLSQKAVLAIQDDSAVTELI